MGALALTSADLREFDGEARVQDLRLAEVLGFENPVNIRRLIRGNLTKLEKHGLIFSAAEKFPGQRRGPAATVYHLNERQAYRLCMWSDAPNADAVQEQMVEVFFAYRHGKLGGGPIGAARELEEAPWERLDQRIAQLERLLGVQTLVGTREFIEASRFAPPIMRRRRPDGKFRKQTNPKHYSVPGAREAVWRLHRQVKIDDAVRLINEECGEGAISRSALGREWCLLDKVRSPE